MNMTKEQILNEITIINKKISVSNNNIIKYRKKLKEFEEKYNSSVSLRDAYQKIISEYYEAIIFKIRKLDRDSAFGNYYRMKLDSIFNGNENYQILDTINQNKRELLKSIDEYENKILYEERKIRDYRLRVKQLQQLLYSAI